MNLLAHLLDEELEVQRHACDFDVHRLGAERVCFAVEFLHHEVEPLADGAAFAEDALQFRQVRAEASEFLIDVDAVGEQRQFLADAFVVGHRHCFAQPGGEFFLVCGEDLRHARRDHGDAFFHRRHAFEQDHFQFFAFARARIGEVFKHGLQRFIAVGAYCLDRDLLHAQHAGPAQDVSRREAGHAGPRQTQFFAERAQLFERLVVQFGRLGGVR